MAINNNTWNKIRYTLYTPIYDMVGKIFANSRKRSIDKLNIKPGERVLIIGAGTGLDLEFIPEDVEVVATDITPSMIGRLKKRSSTVEALVMDGQDLDFPNESFDHVILHLIIAVIPDPVQCLQEAERVLKKGGQIAVFDKFISAAQPSLIRRVFNVLTNLLFSDITRKIENIVSRTTLRIIHSENADFGGNFKILTLKK